VIAIASCAAPRADVDGRTGSPFRDGASALPRREGIVEARSTSLRREQPARSDDEHRACHRGRSAGAASAARLETGAGV
jgi:hypothetical protein